MRTGCRALVVMVAVLAAAGCERGQTARGAGSEGGSGEAFAAHAGGGAEGRATETRSVGSFRGVTLASSAAVAIRRGEEHAVRVTADREHLPDVVTEISDDVLTIDCDADGLVGGCGDVQVEVTLSALREVTIRGSGDVVGSSTFSGDDLAARVRGSGNLELAAEVERLSVDIDGSGDVSIEGRAGAATIAIDGSGDAHLFDLEAGSVDTSIAGSGHVEVTAAEALDVDISGSGDVRYRGSPEVTRSITGSGSVAAD